MDKGITIESVARPPWNTWALVIEFPENEPPNYMIRLLAILGWRPSDRQAPPVGGQARLVLVKPGTGLFGGWTARELETNLEQLALFFGEFVWMRVPHLDAATGQPMVRKGDGRWHFR